MYEDEEIFEQPEDDNNFRIAYKNVVLNPSSKLIHGIVTEAGEKRVRAWTEQGDTVYDTENHATLPKDLFYNTYAIQITVSYDRAEAYLEHLKMGDYGYWHSIFNDFIVKEKDDTNN